MARIRSVKPEFWDDRKLARRTSRDARLLYIALWNLADEHGRLNGDPQWIKGQVFSYDDDMDAATVTKLIGELAAHSVGAVVPYEADGDPYLFLPKLAKHQRLEPEKVKSRLPAPPAPAYTPPDPDPAPPPAETRQSAPRAESSAQRADSSGRRANSSALLYVAGSMEHVAGGREVVAHARVREAPSAPGLAELPDDWKPTEALLRWANATYPGLDLDFETSQFIHHWRSEGRRKKSWPDAWQKWIADSHKRSNGTWARASPPDRRQQATDELFESAARRIAAREGS